jgi:hypothetical protein
VTRNVDLIAVGLLLLGIAAYVWTRDIVAFAMNSHGIVFSHGAHAIIAPAPPPPPPPIALPHVRIMRD